MRRDAEDYIEVWINIPFKTQLGSVRRDCTVRQVEITAAGFLVGKKLATTQAKLRHHTVVQSLVKSVMSVALDRVLIAVEKPPVLGQAEVGQIDENTDTLARLGAERVAQQARETERGEMW